MCKTLCLTFDLLSFDLAFKKLNIFELNKVKFNPGTKTPEQEPEQLVSGSSGAEAEAGSES